MKTLLFAPASYNFAETARLVDIAGACRDKFRVIFASYGGQFEWLITDQGFPLIPLQPRLTPQKIERLYRIMRWESVNHPFGMDHLIDRVKGELAWLKALQPAAVVTGLCLSWPVSCRVAGVPLVWVAQTTSLAPYWRSPRAFWPDILDFRPFRLIPERVLNFLARYLMFFNRLIMVRFNAAAYLFGAKPFKGMEFWEGDYTLLAEPPEFSGINNLPGRFHFLGPLIARLDRDIPPAVKDLPRDLPIVYFAMGSSGEQRIIAGILKAFGGKPYRVIAPVARLLGGSAVDIPANVLVTDWLPAHKVNPMARLSVIHGGLGTVLTACLSGTPIVGVGMHFEQEANLECVVRKGFGVRLRKRRFSPDDVIAAVDRLMNDAEAHRRAQEFKKTIEKYDAPANAARFLAQTFGNR
jgi:UDP:flavonoid glycosyltransferase YjiC (YdhE family)|uniref:Erythromycin biosynthesis protein CIII-like C-terminal domain-containing protein n=1 Tax=Desulfobacca acetoxidans TaxID=60893 RepID=A0A7C3UZ58_9BACT